MRQWLCVSLLVSSQTRAKPHERKKKTFFRINIKHVRAAFLSQVLHVKYLLKCTSPLLLSPLHSSQLYKLISSFNILSHEDPLFKTLNQRSAVSPSLRVLCPDAHIGL